MSSCPANIVVGTPNDVAQIRTHTLKDSLFGFTHEGSHSTNVKHTLFLCAKVKLEKKEQLVALIVCAHSFVPQKTRLILEKMKFGEMRGSMCTTKQ